MNSLDCTQGHVAIVVWSLHPSPASPAWAFNKSHEPWSTSAPGACHSGSGVFRRSRSSRTELHDILLYSNLLRHHRSAPSLRYGAIDSDILQMSMRWPTRSYLRLYVDLERSADPSIAPAGSMADSMRAVEFSSDAARRGNHEGMSPIDETHEFTRILARGGLNLYARAGSLEVLPGANLLLGMIWPRRANLRCQRGGVEPALTFNVEQR